MSDDQRKDRKPAAPSPPTAPRSTATPEHRKVEELFSRLQSYRDETMPFLVIGMLYLLVYAVALVAAMLVFDIPSRPMASCVPFFTIALLLLFGPVFWADHWHAKLQRKHGLICTHCGKPLVKTDGAWLLRTGRCESCDVEVFSQIIPVSHALGGETRQSFKSNSMGGTGCAHELVEIGKSGDGSVYKCRLCGATFRDRNASPPIPLRWNWFFGFALLAISGLGFFGDVLPGLKAGRLQHGSVVGRDHYPTTYWSFMILCIVFSAAALAASIWQFCSAYRKMKGRSHVV